VIPLAIELGVGGAALAFAAGFVSFVSPCVLPLVPGYLSFVSGVGFDELGDRPRRVAGYTAAFVGGFSLMFVALGAGSAWFGGALTENRRTLEILGGVFLLLAAAVYAGLPLPRLLTAERRLQLRERRAGLAGAVLAGVVFAVAWTPCLGPTLGGILTLTGRFGSEPTEGAVLLAIYSLGLGVPFLLFGLGFTKALGLVRWLRRHYRVVGYASAALLVAFAIMLITGDFTRIMTRLASFTGLQI
jgi:cytochrome c-type biogenesis protein